MSMSSFELNDGNKIPVIGYGTGTAWIKNGDDESPDRSLVDAIKIAIKAGYRHIDGAEYYGTEAELGIALKESGVLRTDFFITTKIIFNMSDIPGSLDISLKKLQLDYLDLYLIHAPFFASTKSELQAAWAIMESLQESGRTKSIGVSNCLSSHLQTILDTATIKPAVNQIEFHPYLQSRELLSFAKANSIQIAAFAPLTTLTREKGGPVDEIVGKLSVKYAVAEGTILLRWAIQLGVAVITTSGSEKRLKEYWQAVGNWTLGKDEISEISAAGEGMSVRNFFKDAYDALDNKKDL